MTMRYKAVFYREGSKIGSAPLAWGDGLSEEDAIKDGNKMLAERSLYGKFIRQMHRGEGMGLALVKSETVEVDMEMEEFESQYEADKSDAADACKPGRSQKLALNDGWTQIPPKADGVYWFLNDKPWDGDGAYEDPYLIKIAGGKCVAYMEDSDRDWVPNITEEDQRIWDGASDSHGLAAWRKKQDGESFDNPPPMPVGHIAERVPCECPICNGAGAKYKVNGVPFYLSLFVCYECGWESEQDTSTQDSENLLNAIKTAIAKAGD